MFLVFDMVTKSQSCEIDIPVINWLPGSLENNYFFYPF